jgi:serine/threonine-protein kinase HipA
MKQAKIYMHSAFAGVLTEDENGYRFEYDSDYLASEKAEAVSLTLPLTDKACIGNVFDLNF